MFKAGDKVRCVDDGLSNGALVKGQTYTVEKISSLNNVFVAGMPYMGWLPERFTLAISYTNEGPTFRVKPSKTGVPYDCRSEVKQLLQNHTRLDSATCFWYPHDKFWRVVPGHVEAVEGAQNEPWVAGTAVFLASIDFKWTRGK